MRKKWILQRSNEIRIVVKGFLAYCEIFQLYTRKEWRLDFDI